MDFELPELTAETPAGTTCETRVGDLRPTQNAVGFGLAEVLDNLANVISVKSGEKGLELILDLAPEVPLGVKGDPLRLNQILVNLVNNAIKFTEAGEITIEARLIERSEGAVVLLFAVFALTAIDIKCKTTSAMAGTAARRPWSSARSRSSARTRSTISFRHSSGTV